MRPTLTLCMIVKNESHIILECLNSVYKYIDYWVICDTGSTDNTKEIITNFFKEKGIPGEIHDHEWKNFGHNRTQALVEGRKWCSENGLDLEKVYFLLIDADMIFPGESLRRIIHQADLWDVKQQNPSIIYSNLRAVRASLDVVCVCPTHEYYDIRTPNATRKTYNDVVIQDVGDGGSKSDKAERDIRLLKEALTTDPKNPRYWFYLANTYRDIGDYQNAVLGYANRVEIGGWYEEVYCAWVYKGDCHNSLKQTAHAIECWLEAYNLDRERGEALIRLATHYRTISKHNTSMLFVDKGLKMALPDRVLFQEKIVYDYRFLYELSICAYYTKDHTRGKMACEMLLQRPDLPSHLRESVEKNMVFYLSAEEKEALETKKEDKKKKKIVRFEEKTDSEVVDATS